MPCAPHRLGSVPRADRILPGLSMSRPVLDRRGDLRADPHLLRRLLDDPATRVLRLVGDRAAVEHDPHGSLWAVLAAPDAADHDRLGFYLGEAGGTAYLGVVAGDLPTPAEDDPGWRTLRQVGADLDDLGAELLTTTLALANWHATHTHCPRCGAPTKPSLGGWIRRCPADGSEHYPRTDMAVIVAVVDAADRLLLARGRGFRAGGMSVLAGFVEPGEALAGAVVREVEEESGVRVTDVTYLGDQPWPFPASLMIGFTARAETTELRLQADEIEEARWFTREELVVEVDAGRVYLPGRLSIARKLVEHWYGGPIDAPDVPLR